MPGVRPPVALSALDGEAADDAPEHGPKMTIDAEQIEIDGVKLAINNASGGEDASPRRPDRAGNGVPPP